MIEIFWANNAFAEKYLCITSGHEYVSMIRGRGTIIYVLVTV